MSAIEVQDHLQQLRVERALAVSEGLDANSAYLTDLDGEIAAARHVYVCVAVTEIAIFRAQLSGPQLG
jgi:hypothetical protein